VKFPLTISQQSQHGGSKLAVAEPVKFQSRYSDPNHPANSGSIISLITGGAINPMARKTARRNERRELLGIRKKDPHAGGLIKRMLREVSFVVSAIVRRSANSFSGCAISHGCQSTK
jgi:hypothetical protein